MLWILAALWTRMRWMMVQNSANRWEAEYGSLSREAAKIADTKPGNAAKSLIQQAESYHKISSALARRDRAYDKWQRRQSRADRLKRRLYIATKARTLAGAFNGAVATVGIIVGAELLAGIDLKEQLVLAKTAVSAYLAAL